MTFQQLQYLLAVERNGSLSLAAKELFITQSAVSNTLAALEKELNCRIFTRSAYGLALTPEGKRVISYAKRICENYNLLTNEAKVVGGQLRVSAPNYAPACRAFSRILEEYKDRTVFLFFHSQMQGKVGDFNDNSERLDMCTYTEDYKRLDAYFKQYTNVIFFNGHSHNSFSQVLEEDLADRVINTYNGEYATLVHLPSLGQSQTGHIVHVYEDCIVFEGYHFGNEETFAYATFIIEK